MMSITTLILFLVGFNDTPRIVEPKTDPHFKIEDHSVSETYLLSVFEKIVIAKKNSNSEGLKVFYMNEDKIIYESSGVGESYIYKPTFYEFNDGTILIACEKGFEYSLGIDVFEVKKNRIQLLGSLNLASDVNGNQESIIPNMSIKRRFEEQYLFEFKGIIYIEPGTREETNIEGSKIKGTYVPETGKISLLIKK